MGQKFKEKKESNLRNWQRIQLDCFLYEVFIIQVRYKMTTYSLMATVYHFGNLFLIMNGLNAESRTYVLAQSSFDLIDLP